MPEIRTLWLVGWYPIGGQSVKTIYEGTTEQLNCSETSHLKVFVVAFDAYYTAAIFSIDVPAP